MARMTRKTVALPDDLAAALKALSVSTGLRQSELARRGLTRVLQAEGAMRPAFPVFASGDPIAHRVDELLGDGFGAD